MSFIQNTKINEGDFPMAIRSWKYLKENRIIDLLNMMSSLLVFHQPGKVKLDEQKLQFFSIIENPREYMIKHLEELTLARNIQCKHPSLFDDSNLTSIFGILDPTKSGFISATKYKEGNLSFCLPLNIYYIFDSFESDRSKKIGKILKLN